MRCYPILLKKRCNWKHSSGCPKESTSTRYASTLRSLRRISKKSSSAAAERSINWDLPYNSALCVGKATFYAIRAECRKWHWRLWPLNWAYWPLLTTLNERIKSGDVTVAHSRRWTDFEKYLIPRTIWDVERKRHYASLGLPLDVEVYLAKLKDHLAAVTTEVDSHHAPSMMKNTGGGWGESSTRARPRMTFPVFCASYISSFLHCPHTKQRPRPE